MNSPLNLRVHAMRYEAQGIVSEQGHNGNREVLAPPPFD